MWFSTAGPQYRQPSGALVRAMAMTSTVDMTGVTGYPSNAEGFGRIKLNNLFDSSGARSNCAWDLRNAVGLLPGQLKTYKFLVGSSSVPLRVAMTFTDFPAAVNAAQAAVNDVNLEVISPSGLAYRGNVWSGGVSVTGGSADAINSTEMVMLNAPETGVWEVRVRCQTVNMGTRQGYAVVANGPVSYMPGLITSQ